MPRVIISSGHTQNEPGSTAFGLVEYDLARKIAKATLPYLRQNGIITLSVPPNLDIIKRLDWINKTGYDESTNDITVEIHINEGGKRGIEVWYEGEGNNNSQKLSQLLLDSVTAETGLPKQEARSEYDHEFGSIAFLHDANPITSLIECCYIDNEEDANFLKNEQNLDKIAKGVAKGILGFYGIEYREVMPTQMPQTQAAGGNFPQSLQATAQQTQTPGQTPAQTQVVGQTAPTEQTTAAQAGTTAVDTAFTGPQPGTDTQTDTTQTPQTTTPGESTQQQTGGEQQEAAATETNGTDVQAAVSTQPTQTDADGSTDSETDQTDPVPTPPAPVNSDGSITATAATTSTPTIQTDTGEKTSPQPPADTTAGAQSPLAQAATPITTETNNQEEPKSEDDFGDFGGGSFGNNSFGGGYGGSNFGGGGSQQGGFGGGSGIMSREERKKMIEDYYVKILGRKPNQNDLNYFLNIGINEQDLIKKMVDSQEHADLVKSRQEEIKIKEKFQEQQSELQQLRASTEDQKVIIRNLHAVIAQKNEALAQIQYQLNMMQAYQQQNTGAANQQNNKQNNEKEYKGTFLDKLFKAFSDLFE